MREIKYIIVRDRITGRLRHFKSDWLHHYTIARDNGFAPSEILESGLFLDSTMYILDCILLTHLKHKEDNFIGNRLNFYQDKKLEAWLRGRELESQLYYDKKAIGLREGD
jgi:hypothetical protein